MRRLGEILHRIGLPGEDDPSSEICRQRLQLLLENSIACDIRDPPEFLDAVGALYKKAANLQLNFGYLLLLGVLVHCRHLTICLQTGSTGLGAATLRLQNLDDGFSSIVIDATKRFLESSADKSQSNEAFVRAVIDSTGSWCTSSSEKCNSDSKSKLEIAEEIKHLKGLIGTSESRI